MPSPYPSPQSTSRSFSAPKISKKERKKRKRDEAQLTENEKTQRRGEAAKIPLPSSPALSKPLGRKTGKAEQSKVRRTTTALALIHYTSYNIVMSVPLIREREEEDEDEEGCSLVVKTAPVRSP